MNNAPQAKIEIQAAAFCDNSGFVASGNRHLVLVSHPIVTNSRMLVTLNIRDWDEHFCFLYPVDDIDHIALRVHIMWKLSVYEDKITPASAEMDLTQKNPELLNIKHWKFV